MKKIVPSLLLLLALSRIASAQLEPAAGSWKPWFIASVKAHRLPPPPAYKQEVAQVIAGQQQLQKDGEAALHKAWQWSAGAPGYRWQEMLSKVWVYDTSFNGILANLVLGTAIYDATLVAWDTKYAYKRPRPAVADGRIRSLVPAPQSPSYPCEYSVAAGVAVAVISHYYPAMADSVKKMARQLMDARVALGTAFPSDTRAGFDLGKKIAEEEILHVNTLRPARFWDGNVPTGAGYWRGKKPMFPTAGYCKTVVLDSASQFRPGPPPDFAKEMAELKNYKQTFRSKANAFFYAGGTGDDLLNKKIFEYNLHLNPPRAARVYAAVAVTSYDAFVACWDAKYTYWGIRPDQYDTTFKSLLPTPPFPGYPSGHAAMGGTIAELYTYFFPADAQVFQQRARDGAESRFQGGIHFRSDNEVGTELGKKVASAVVQRLRKDGADPDGANRPKTATVAKAQ